MMTFTRVAMVCGLAGVLWAAPPAGSAQSPGPAARIASVVDEVITLLKNDQLDKMTRRARLRETIGPHFDFETMSRSILGAQWKKASDEERSRFIALFQEMLEDTYIAAMDEYAGQTVEIGKERIQGKLASVATTINRPNGVATPVSYSMRTKNDEWVAYDVSVEGVSLVNNYRSSFRGIVRKDGMSGLLDTMNKKVNGQS